jgi:hypothetical protein
MQYSHRLVQSDALVFALPAASLRTPASQCPPEEEPPHVHIEREDKTAKFWLDTSRLQRSSGFGRAEIGRIQKIVNEHHAELLETWNDYFGS